MKVLNFGSMNLDYVYQVDHFVRPGETLSSASRAVKAGGKGLNQSVALARAGAQVCHAGCLGMGGEPLRELLVQNGVDVGALRPVEEMQGHTVIQVTPDGENCILLYGGSNRCVTEEQIETTLTAFGPGDWLLLQNEVNLPGKIVDAAYARGLRVVLNPSPYDEKLRDVDFAKLSWLLVNEVEAAQIAGTPDPEKAWAVLRARCPGLSVLVTLGKRGSVAFSGGQAVRQDAVKVTAVDTTGAGDTYTGYFLAALMAGEPLQACMEQASRAAALSVTRPGAADSIPWKNEL